MKYFIFSFATVFMIVNITKQSQAVDFIEFFKGDQKDSVLVETQNVELKEIEMLTGNVPMAINQPAPQTPSQTEMNIVNDGSNEGTKPIFSSNNNNDHGTLTLDHIIWAEETGESKITNHVIPIRKPSKASPDLIKVIGKKPMNISVSDVVWAAAPSVEPVAKPAPENFAKTLVEKQQKSIVRNGAYDLSDPTVSMAMQVQGATETSLPLPAPTPISVSISGDYVYALPEEELRPTRATHSSMIVENVTFPEIKITEEKPLFTEADIQAAEITIPEKLREELESIKACPQLNIFPEARSITYFAEDGSAVMNARAAIDDVRGGCEAVLGGLEIDLDIVMKGHITDRGRFNRDRNLESFITFPYFLTVISPESEIEDKKILATAMRFQPVNNHITHAEKITQFVPMDDLSRAHEYQLSVGFQLTRKQLAYNRAQTTLRATNERTTPDVMPAQRRSYDPLKENNF